ncbi:MAG: NAD-dependent epimerase/dehydratase family protein [Anaerolineae bacterium]|nr:NAD-dependent epimerase/dehydratase family protein [Anaerolineae bacterium]
MGKIVAITGAAGYLGQVLIQHLQTLSWVERIIALDVRPVAANGRVISHALDVRESSFMRAILAEHGVTHLVHGAFHTSLPANMSPDQMRSNNVDGSQLALKTALELGVEQALFVSSVSVYGYRGGNPPQVREDHRLWPNMAYGQHKVLVENFLRDMEHHYPNTQIAIMRLAALAGPRGRLLSPLMAMTAQPVFVLSNGGRAMTQALHEDDAAAFITRVLETNVAGTFNVAPNDAASWSSVARISRRTPFSLPRLLLNLAARFNRLLPELKGFNREVVDYLSESLVVDNTAARTQLGWKPRFGTLDAFGQMFGTQPILRVRGRSPSVFSERR